MALESLVVESGLGSNAAADAVLACALWLLEQDDACLSELHAIAVREGHALISAMLADAAPHRSLASGGRLSPRDVPITARVVRYVFAQSDFHYLSDASRVRGARRDASRPASQRLDHREAPGRPLGPRGRCDRRSSPSPTTPAIVRLITSCSRWIKLPNVRAALLANPCTPTRIALLLAATCLPRRRGIAAAGNVHPRIRELARLVRAHAESRAAPSGG